MLTGSVPRGIRNNNAGNIRKNPSFSWQGEIGVDDAGFVIFDTAENGLRALARVLRTYREKHGIFTLEGIINRWAPPHENDTESYINHAANKLGVDPFTELALARYPELVAVIVTHENGQQPYSSAQINRGLELAYA